ncbi:MAG: chemotaxis protein CheX [Planctomycetales bacterium]|nr:chemotaxis protein CheX [Planctomycetales bacterium]
MNEYLVAEVMERNAKKIRSDDLAFQEDAHPTELQQRLVQCLVDSTKTVFSTMCGIKLHADSDSVKNCHGESFQVSGIIGFSGAVKATIVVSVHQNLIFSAAETFLGIRPEEIDSDVTDLVGELANMIAGNAKERMNLPGINLGLPTVVAGQGHKVTCNSILSVTMLPFSSDFGSLSIELCTT